MFTETSSLIFKWLKTIITNQYGRYTGEITVAVFTCARIHHNTVYSPVILWLRLKKKKKKEKAIFCFSTESDRKLDLLARIKKIK